MRFKIILTGAPSSGKTTTLNALREKLKDDKKYHFVEEVATRYIEEEQKAGHDPFKDIVKLEEIVMARQIKEEDAVNEEDSCSILDRSLIDDVAITLSIKKRTEENDIKQKLDQVVGKMKDAAKTRNYNLVFILERLPLVNTKYRLETEDEAKAQYDAIKETYSEFHKELGYTVISVPSRTSNDPQGEIISVEKRVEFICNKIQQFQLTSLQRMSVTPDAPLRLFEKSSPRSLASNTLISGATSNNTITKPF